MHAIQARRLSKTYGKPGNEVHALRGVNLDIPQGQFVSIMGPSGSGKSTLMHLLGLLDAPTSGGIRVMGQVASRLTDKQRTLARRKHMGFIFQAFHLIPRTSALQNVMLPLALGGTPYGRRKEMAQQALRSVGLGDRMGNKPSELSGGQKQRVAIARALALQPPILLADEPTGNLDSRTTQEIMELFADLHNQGKTIVQVTHDRDMAAYGERIIVVKDGRIVRSGGA
ncbi:MAG: ABC transporter ATP-binding protein [Thermoplasmatota archaeon]